VATSLSPDIQPLRERSTVSKASKTEEESGMHQSNTEVEATQGGSETQQGIVRMKQKTKSKKKEPKKQELADSSALPEEGGI
jgi:hypothetical protein